MGFWFCILLSLLYWSNDYYDVTTPRNRIRDDDGAPNSAGGRLLIEGNLRNVNSFRDKNDIILRDRSA
jgi:hypothetical protein